MGEEKDKLKFIEETKEFHGEAATKKRQEAEAKHQAQELFKSEFAQLEMQFSRLQAAYQLIQDHYKLSKELADNEQLQKNLAILATFTTNLTPLINRITSYANSVKDDTQKTQQLTQQLQTLNAALKKTCDTTLLYDIAKNIKQAYPQTYGAFLILGPIDFVLLILALPLAIAGAYSFPVIISLIAIAGFVSILIPVLHGASILLEKKSAANNAIKLSTENLDKLEESTSTIDNEFTQLIPPSSASSSQKPAETKTSYNPYQGIYTTSGNDNAGETPQHFLEKQDVTQIKNNFSQSL